MSEKVGGWRSEVEGELGKRRERGRVRGKCLRLQ